MRQTHGFQHQAESLRVQETAVTEVTHAQEPGSFPQQQVQAHLESQENPKRKTRSDYECTNQTNHPLDMMTPGPAKGDGELAGEYITPITLAIPHSDTPSSGSGDAVTLAADGANTDQALDAIPVKPIKNPTEAADKFAEPIHTDHLPGGQSGSWYQRHDVAQGG